MNSLKAPAESLGKIAKSIAPVLKKIGIQTVEDLIFYYPRRWLDFSQVVAISSITSEKEISIKGRVDLINSRRSFKRRLSIAEAIISDASGKIKIIWFGQNYISKILAIGDEVYISGKASLTKDGWQFTNPIFEKIGQKETIHTARLIPIYPLTSKLTQKQLRTVIKEALKNVRQIKEHLPVNITEALKLPNIQEALLAIHFPKTKDDLERAKKRLKFDELFIIQLASLKTKFEWEQNKAATITFKEKETKDFIENLNFSLTLAQKKAGWEIIKDLEKEKPMNRLLEGDVGSGKTIVAALAMLNIALTKKQTAIMVPTEILAKQHFDKLTDLFRCLKFKIGLLSANNYLIFENNEITKESKKTILEKLKTGQIDIIIGTHSLIQKNVLFKNLTLVIVDEQHRFGVRQRSLLTEQSKGKTPHFLSMSATPIPRTLALTVYGDLNLSIIDELPKGRKKIKSQIVAPQGKEKIYSFIKQEIEEGRQAFIICPLVQESEKLQVKAAEDEYKKLKAEVFPELKLGLIHGRQKNEEKEKTMKEFAENKINILVATPVIEVGIDIPNASIMIIENAERFGLSQLHQFRGRIGRGQHQSYCFLFADFKNKESLKRLDSFIKSENGFQLAEYDLELRGPGEVYGVRQSGFLEILKLATLTDWKIIKEARNWGERIMAVDPELEQLPDLKEKIYQFKSSFHLE